jgi:hypothetical protein
MESLWRRMMLLVLLLAGLLLPAPPAAAAAGRGGSDLSFFPPFPRLFLTAGSLISSFTDGSLRRLLVDWVS